MLRILCVLFVLATPCNTEELQEVAHSRVKRIIGGQTAGRGEWPWLVHLRGKFVTERIPFLGIPIRYKYKFCGGSVLNDRWILTAAHCFDDISGGRNQRYWEARLATTTLRDSAIQFLSNIVSLFTSREELRTWEIDLDRIIIHPSYDKSNLWKDDIALVRLEEPVPSGRRFSRIRRIQLPPAGNSSFPAGGQDCVMKGWGCTAGGSGISRYAQEVSLPIVDTNNCVTVWRATHNQNRMCAGFQGFNVGICPGDSGGPLVCRDSNRDWIQVGVASFTSLYHPESYPGVFTRVSSYVNWIRSVID